MKFELKCLTDVENYWTELQNVCTRTPLNRRSYMSDDHVSAVDYEDPEFDSGEFNSSKGRAPGDRGKNAEFIRKDWFREHLT